MTAFCITGVSDFQSRHILLIPSLNFSSIQTRVKLIECNFLGFTGCWWFWNRFLWLNDIIRNRWCDLRVRIESMSNTLQWRHYGRDGVSNHQPHDCLLNRLFMCRSKKISKLRLTGLCAREFSGDRWIPHTGPVTRKMIPFDNIIITNSSRLYLKMITKGNHYIIIKFIFWQKIHKTQLADDTFKCFLSMYQAEQVPSQYLDQWWPGLLTYIYMSPGPSAFHINFLYYHSKWGAYVESISYSHTNKSKYKFIIDSMLYYTPHVIANLCLQNTSDRSISKSFRWIADHQVV